MNKIKRLYVVSSMIDEGEKIEVMLVKRDDAETINVDYTSDEAEPLVDQFVQDDGVIGRDGNLDFDTFMRRMSSDLGRPIILTEFTPGIRRSVSPASAEIS